MSSRRRLAQALGFVATLSAGDVAGQSRGHEVFGGVEYRSVDFESLPLLDRLRQTVVPFGFTLSAGRFSIDGSGSWVSTRMDRVDGTDHTVSAFTDTQVRGAYVFGSDAVVATLLVNLPTGLKRATPKDYNVIGAISPGFLGFPVATYASGFSVTSGLAAAAGSGNWSFGVAGSLRMSSEFTPYEDLNGPLTYKPGVEGRIRGGIDGLIGSSRLSLGLTYSTFGNDEFGQGGATQGAYKPGARWVAEGELTAPVGAGTLSLSLWHFKRNAGDTTGASVRNKENLTGAEATVTIPVSAAFSIEPLVSGRWTHPQAGSGHLYGIGTSLRVRMGSSASLIPTFRYDNGEIKDPAGHTADLKGVYASLILKLYP